MNTNIDLFAGNLNYLDEVFQSLFIESDSKVNDCPHEKIESWPDGRGYCTSCGETFTDASDKNSVITNCKHERIHKDNSGVPVCSQCGLEFKTLDF